MAWRDFMDFWLMLELGAYDSIVRNYVDLRDDGVAWDNDSCCFSGYARLGLPQTHNLVIAIGEVQAKLRSYGVIDPPPRKVRIRLNQFYQWDRIREGELRRAKVIRQPGLSLI